MFVNICWIMSVTNLEEQFSADVNTWPFHVRPWPSHYLFHPSPPPLGTLSLASLAKPCQWHTRESRSLCMCVLGNQETSSCSQGFTHLGMTPGLQARSPVCSCPSLFHLCQLEPLRLSTLTTAIKFEINDWLITQIQNNNNPSLKMSNSCPMKHSIFVVPL